MFGVGSGGWNWRVWCGEERETNRVRIEDLGRVVLCFGVSMFRVGLDWGKVTKC